MKTLVTDELWAVVVPPLPRRRAQSRGGRPWVDDRATLNGVPYVLRTGIAWGHLPTELGAYDGLAGPLPSAHHPLRAARRLHRGLLYLACALICWNRLERLQNVR